MNKKIHYIENPEAFWRGRAKARQKLREYMANLPFSKKIEIIEKMRANHIAMRNAKKIT